MYDNHTESGGYIKFKNISFRNKTEGSFKTYHKRKVQPWTDSHLSSFRPSNYIIPILLNCFMTEEVTFPMSFLETSITLILKLNQRNEGKNFWVKIPFKDRYKTY